MTIKQRRPGRPRYRWAAIDAKLNGALAHLLREWDAERLPWAQVVNRIHERTGERITIVTARKWTHRAYEELGHEQA